MVELGSLNIGNELSGSMSIVVDMLIQTVHGMNRLEQRCWNHDHDKSTALFICDRTSICCPGMMRYCNNIGQ